MKNVRIWWMSMLLFSLSSFAQTEQEDLEQTGHEIGVEEMESETGEAEAGRFYAFPDRSLILRQLQWSWEILGPDYTPEESGVGGASLPDYAAGRGNGTGRINRLYQHVRRPNVMMACSPTGGLFVSLDHGARWTSAGTDALPISGVSAVALHPRNTKKWILATGDGDDNFMWNNGLWYTRDGGKHYTELTSNAEGGFPFSHVEDAGAQVCDVVEISGKWKRLLVATNKGLWMSTGALRPGRLQWERVSDGEFYDIEVLRMPGKKEPWIVACGSKLLLARGDVNFEEIAAPAVPDAERFKYIRMNAEWSKSRADMLYVVITCSEAPRQSALGEGTLHALDLQNMQWTFLSNLKKGADNVITFRARAFAVSPQDDHLMLCGNIQPVHRTTDGGRTWAKVEKKQMHDDIHDFLFDADGTTVWCSHDGGVSKSVDGGVHWDRKDDGIGAANVFGVSTAQTLLPQVIYGGYDVGANLLEDGKWTHVSWGDGFETITHPRDSNTMYCSQQNGVLYKRNAKGAWINASPLSSKTEWHTWMRMHPVNHDMLFCAGQRMMRSIDGGAKWELMLDAKKMDQKNFSAYRFFLSDDHPGVMYVYMLTEDREAPVIYRTFNVTAPKVEDIVWEKVADLPVRGWIMNIAVDQEDPRQFWVLYNRMETTGKIWKYNGSTYIDETQNLATAKCESMVLERGSDARLYLGSNYGVFTKEKGESQWTLLRGLPGTFIKSMDINYKSQKLIVATYGRGIWQGDLVRKK